MTLNEARGRTIISRISPINGHLANAEMAWLTFLSARLSYTIFCLLEIFCFVPLVKHVVQQVSSEIVVAAINSTEYFGWGNNDLLWLKLYFLLNAEQANALFCRYDNFYMNFMHICLLASDNSQASIFLHFQKNRILHIFSLVASLTYLFEFSPLILIEKDVMDKIDREINFASDGSIS